MVMASLGDGADVMGSDSDAKGLPKKGYDMAIDDSDERLDDGDVVDVLKAARELMASTCAAVAVAAAAAAARRRLLLDPLFRPEGSDERDDDSI